MWAAKACCLAVSFLTANALFHVEQLGKPIIGAELPLDRTLRVGQLGVRDTLRGILGLPTRFSCR